MPIQYSPHFTSLNRSTQESYILVRSTMGLGGLVHFGDFAFVALGLFYLMSSSLVEEVSKQALFHIY
jgi:hypothetical protein